MKWTALRDIASQEELRFDYGGFVQDFDLSKDIVSTIDVKNVIHGKRSIYRMVSSTVSPTNSDAELQHALITALNSMRINVDGPQVDCAIASLAHCLGVRRLKMSILRTLKAVLAEMTWPDKFKESATVIQAYKGSGKHFYKLKAQLIHVYNNAVAEKA